MNDVRWFVLLAAVTLAATSIGLAAPAPPPAETRAVELFDIKLPTTAKDASSALCDASDRQRVPPDKLDHTFQGDTVVRNQHIAVVLRKDSLGVEVYSRSPQAWNRRAVLIPCGLKPAQRLVSVKPTLNDGETVAVEATFEALDGQTLGLACELGQQAVFVKAEPRGETSRLRVESSGRFGVIPDFYADDIVLDATKMLAPQTHIPSENMVAQHLDGDALAVTLWDGPPQDIAVTLAGSGGARRIAGLEIDWTRRGKAYLALLDFPGACYAGTLERLPDAHRAHRRIQAGKPGQTAGLADAFPCAMARGLRDRKAGRIASAQPRDVGPVSLPGQRRPLPRLPFHQAEFRLGLGRRHADRNERHTRQVSHMGRLGGEGLRASRRGKLRRSRLPLRPRPGHSAGITDADRPGAADPGRGALPLHPGRRSAAWLRRRASSPAAAPTCSRKWKAT